MINLTQLLAASRSFMGVRAGPRPYRMGQGLLPKFGPVAAPVSAAPAGSEGSRPPASGGSGPSSGGGLSRALAAWRGATTRSGGGEASQRVVAAAVEHPAEASASEITSRPGSSGARTIPAVARPAPFQTEFALTSVRVVRNDLAEDDLEVVPVAAAEPARSTDGKAPRALAARESGARRRESQREFAPGTLAMA